VLLALVVDPPVVLRRAGDAADHQPAAVRAWDRRNEWVVSAECAATKAHARHGGRR
jgi:hypothetical protein